MIIRQAIKGDYEKIYTLVKDAFVTAEVTNGKEQDYVNELRAKDSYIPQMEFIAEEKGELIGHILLSKAVVKTKNGNYSCLYIAPVCVAL